MKAAAQSEAKKVSPKSMKFSINYLLEEAGGERRPSDAVGEGKRQKVATVEWTSTPNKLQQKGTTS